MANRKTHQDITDLAIVGGPTEDGQGAHLLRVRDGQVSAGEIRPVREGQSITGSELLRLRPLDAARRVCAVEVLHAPDAPAADPPRSTKAHAATDVAGPLARRARVSNDRYRKNWDTVFDSGGKRRGKPDFALN